MSERSQGWLRYLYRKATTADSWDRQGQPHGHWDNISEAPMLSWRRFDLIDATYAVALMADRTPAWREVYQTILDELIVRHTGWWAAEDWLTQFGHDPDRANYPDIYRLLIPENRWGRYDSPGWTANGIWPWGVQMDPIGADGNLFFKGWFLVMLGLHLRATGDPKWNTPFDMIRDGENTFRWHHSKIADHLATQWRSRPLGCHCENTKIWPLCLSAAGLGLQLHDLLKGTNHHQVFDDWWERTASPYYFGFDTDGKPADLVTFYYDPIIDYHHRLPVGAVGIYPAYYLAAQRPVEARTLFAAAVAGSGIVDATTPPGPLGARTTAILIHLAKEWGMTDLAAAVQASAEEHYRPTWDRARGEFYWLFDVEEPHPRGQHNGAMAGAEVMSEGAWSGLALVGPGERFAEPTVAGVDFPTVTVTSAWWDPDTEELHVGLAPMTPSHAGPTAFRVGQLPAGEWTAAADHGVGVSLRREGENVVVESESSLVELTVRRS